MATKLTKKERGFVKEILKGKNGTEAVLAVYDTDKDLTAASIASQNLRKPKIVKAIEDALPDELLAEKHLALLNKQDENGNIDVQAVKAGLDMGYKIKGSYAPEKRSVQVDLTEIKNKDDVELAKLAGLEN